MSWPKMGSLGPCLLQTGYPKEYHCHSKSLLTSNLKVVDEFLLFFVFLDDGRKLADKFLREDLALDPDVEAALDLVADLVLLQVGHHLQTKAYWVRGGTSLSSGLKARSEYQAHTK